MAAGLLVLVPLLVLLRTALEEGLGPLLEAVASAGAGRLGLALDEPRLRRVLAIVIGATLAVLTERTDVPGRRGLRLAMLLAFIVPGYVAALGWLNTYGPGGLFDDLLGVAAPALVGPLGIVVVMGVEAAPIAYLIVVAGLPHPRRARPGARGSCLGRRTRSRPSAA